MKTTTVLNRLALRCPLGKTFRISRQNGQSTKPRQRLIWILRAEHQLFDDYIPMGVQPIISSHLMKSQRFLLLRWPLFLLIQDSALTLVVILECVVFERRITGDADVGVLDVQST